MQPIKKKVKPRVKRKATEIDDNDSKWSEDAPPEEPQSFARVERYVPEQIIVVCPGSYTLKIGLASNQHVEPPIEVPSVMAIRRRLPNESRKKPKTAPAGAAETDADADAAGDATSRKSSVDSSSAMDIDSNDPSKATPAATLPSLPPLPPSTLPPPVTNPPAPLPTLPTPLPPASLPPPVTVDPKAGDTPASAPSPSASASASNSRHQSSHSYSHIPQEPIVESEKRNQLIDVVVQNDLRRIHGMHGRPLDQYFEMERQQSYTAANSTSVIPHTEDFGSRWTDVSEKPQFVFGEDALKIAPHEPYDIVRPFRHGSFAIDDKTSLQCVLDRVERLLVHAVQRHLKIPKAEFSDYCVAFVVPSAFCKFEITSFMQIILEALKFRAVFLALEPVVACFGTAFSGACVVDVGHQSTSVCCVQQGKVIEGTRVLLPFGGEDITELCCYFVRSRLNEFYSPFREHPLASKAPRVPLLTGFNKMKHSVCRFPENSRRMVNYCMAVRSYHKPTVDCKLTMSDACVLPPLCLFRPQMIAERVTDFTHLQMLDEAHVAYDHLGRDFLDEFGNPFNKQRDSRGLTIDAQIIEEKKSRSERRAPTRHLIGLDEAIVRSISNISNDESRSTMATSLLLVGGSAHLPGLAETVESWVKDAFSRRATRMAQVEVLPRREHSTAARPEHCSWLGMAIIASGESSKDMWITSSDWTDCNAVRLLRERVPFDISSDIVK